MGSDESVFVIEHLDEVLSALEGVCRNVSRATNRRPAAKLDTPRLLRDIRERLRELSDASSVRPLSDDELYALRCAHEVLHSADEGRRDRRYHLGVLEVQKAALKIRAHESEAGATLDAAILLTALEAVGFPVMDYWLRRIAECVALLRAFKSSKTDKAGRYAATGLLARLLIPANAAEQGGSIDDVTHSIKEARRRERAREKKK